MDVYLVEGIVLSGLASYNCYANHVYLYAGEVSNLPFLERTGQCGKLGSLDSESNVGSEVVILYWNLESRSLTFFIFDFNFGFHWGIYREKW